MHIEQIYSGNTHWNTIISPDTELVVCHLSFDIPTPTNSKDVVLRRLYTDLILSGAGRYNREAFINAVNLAGGSIAVQDTSDKIHFTIETVEANMPKIISLFKTMILEPTFLESELIRAKRLLSQSLPLEQEKARFIAASLLRQSLYPQNHPAYSWLPESLLAAVEKSTRRDIVSFHNFLLKTSYTASLLGSKKSVQSLQKTLKGILSATHIVLLGPIEEKKPEPEIIVRTIPSHENIELSIGQNVPLIKYTPEFLSLNFGIMVLAKWGGFSGRLMNTVRERDGLTYGIYGRLENFTNTQTGNLRIMTFFAPTDVDKGCEIIKKEINLLLEKGITTAEYERFKQIIKTGFLLSFDSLPEILELIHQNTLTGATLEEYKDAIRYSTEVITKKSVNNALCTLIHPDNFVYAMAGNIDKSQLKMI